MIEHPTVMDELGKYINLQADDRFVPTALLRSAYLRYDKSRNPSAPPYVRFEDEGIEMGIVSSEVPEMARAVSSLLSRSLEDAKDKLGGHLPSAIVERVQLEVISPQRVAQLWGPHGHRFVLSRQEGDRSEIIGTILVARRKGSIFFFTGRYNNVRHSAMERDIDWQQPADKDPNQKWFSLFAFPPPPVFKPLGYHHIANFVVAKEHRRQGLARFFLKALLTKYARDYIDLHGGKVEHSQFLLCGKGFWQIGDPPWLERMERLGFSLRWGAESFFMERDWAPLPPIFADGKQISNVDYNTSFGLPKRYEDHRPPPRPGMHLVSRIPDVIKLAQDPRAKLQYFQVYWDFV
jgi:GNAT superfamily N-acetyltransferase